MYNAANNASSQLAQAIGAEDTSLTVLDGSSFPDAPFLVSIEGEIIEVGAKDGNTFSALVRGTEGTTPASHASGSRVENRFTAGTYQQIVDKINNLKAEEIEYTSEVTSFTPTQVAAALDALAGVRIVEMGSNANGEYVRWENGLQVCYTFLTLTYSGSARLQAGWTFPASFVDADRIVAALITYVEGDVDMENVGLIYDETRSAVSGQIKIAGSSFTTQSTLHANALAIGRWK